MPTPSRRRAAPRWRRPTSRTAPARWRSPSPWRGDPAHARLHALAAGICAAVPATIAAGQPLVLLVDGDIGMSLGRIIRNEIAPAANVIAIDGVQLKQFDYVDIGRVIDVTNVVPVIIKSLLFK